MAKDHSFDITCDVSMMEVDNALNTTNREVTNRYDFKGIETKFERKDKELTLETADEMKLNAVKEMFAQKLAKRGVSVKAIQWKEPERAGGDRLRCKGTIQSGIPQEKAKEIVREIKALGLKKINPAIQGESIRITSPDIDTLQDCMAKLREKDFKIAVEFTNYR